MPVYLESSWNIEATMRTRPQMIMAKAEVQQSVVLGLEKWSASRSHPPSFQGHLRQENAVIACREGHWWRLTSTVVSGWMKYRPVTEFALEFVQHRFDFVVQDLQGLFGFEACVFLHVDVDDRVHGALGASLHSHFRPANEKFDRLFCNTTTAATKV